MGTEIEHKFLVEGEAWRAGVTASRRIRQGYLASTEQVTVRVRAADDRAYLTVKGATEGITRAEYEYEIPAADAARMLDTLCGDLVEKTRHLVPVGAHTWEVDVFEGANAGLVVAEVELAAADEPFERPAWALRDVSADARYLNASLARRPYSSW